MNFLATMQNSATKFSGYLKILLHYIFILNKLSIMNNKRQEMLKNAHLSHKESMRKSLNSRLSAARASGNEALVKQLEAEAKYLHL